VPAPIFQPFEPGRRDIIDAKQAELFAMTNGGGAPSRAAQ
jgi:hypothetical protein